MGVSTRAGRKVSMFRHLAGTHMDNVCFGPNLTLSSHMTRSHSYFTTSVVVGVLTRTSSSVCVVNHQTQSIGPP